MCFEEIPFTQRYISCDAPNCEEIVTIEISDRTGGFTREEVITLLREQGWWCLTLCESEYTQHFCPRHGPPKVQ